MNKKECKHEEWNPCGNNFYSCRQCGILRTSQQVNLYEEKDRRIADLEAKLAKYKNVRFLDEKTFQDYCAYKHIEPQIKGCLDRERQYKRQVAEKDADLNQIYSHLSVEAFGEDIHEQALKEIGRLQIELAQKDKELEKAKTTNDRLYNKNKKLENQLVENNIRYYKKGAVEQLEKVKELFESCWDYEFDIGEVCNKSMFYDKLEQLIAELTHQHEDK